MLSRKYSLSKKKEIQRVFDQGQIYFSPFFNIKILHNNLDYPRFCVVVSTKISKKAVARNKLKRQLKSIIYNNLTKISKNYDIIILTKPPALAIKFKQLEEKLLFLFKKAEII